MIFSCCYPFGKAGAIQIRRCQGIAVDYYGGTLGVLALNRSGFCNVGVKREGSSHSLWINAKTGAIEAIPRHKEIKEPLAHKILKNLEAE